MRYLILFFYLMLLSLNASAAHLHPESYYQNLWCKANNGLAEYELHDKTRVDCLTAKYAIEFDFANKWAEAIGQSLYYAAVTKKTPAIVLIIESTGDYKYYYRIKPICDRLGIVLFKM